MAFGVPKIILPSPTMFPPCTVYLNPLPKYLPLDLSKLDQIPAARARKVGFSCTFTEARVPTEIQNLPYQSQPAPPLINHTYAHVLPIYLTWAVMLKYLQEAIQCVAPTSVAKEMVFYINKLVSRYMHYMRQY